MQTDTVNDLAEAFDRLADHELLPLSRIDECPVRNSIDEAVSRGLGVDPRTVAAVRRALAYEPTVSSRGREVGPFQPPLF